MATEIFSSTQLTLLRDTPSRIKNALDLYASKVADIIRKPRWGAFAQPGEQKQFTDQMRAELAQARAGVLGDIDTLRDNVGRYRDAVGQQINAALGRPAPKDNTEALLHEQREARAWARMKPVLDRAQPNPLAKIKDLAAAAVGAGDQDALTALRAELPAYLEGRADEVYTLAALEALDKTIAQNQPYLTSALDTRREIEKGCYNLSLSFNYLEDAIRREELSVMIVGWDGKVETVSLGMSLPRMQ